VAWAKANGYTYILKVRSGANLSSALLEAEANGDIIIEFLP